MLCEDLYTRERCRLGAGAVSGPHTGANASASENAIERVSVSASSSAIYKCTCF